MAKRRNTVRLNDLLEKLKQNLIVSHSEDDELLERLLRSAIDIAAHRQNKPNGYYDTNPMTFNTECAVIMLASHLYESRDGSTGGFWGDSPAAAENSLKTIYAMLALDKDWSV